MRKTLRHIALIALTAVFLTGQTATAFADNNYGPGMLIDNPQPDTTNTDTNDTAAQAGDTQTETQTGDGTQAGDTQQAGDGTQTGDAQQTSDGTQAGDTQQAGDGTQAGDAQQAGDGNIQTTPTREITESTPVLQFQFLRPDMTWTDPVRTDVTMLPGDAGFISMSVYAINLPGLRRPPRLEQLGHERRTHRLDHRPGRGRTDPFKRRIRQYL